MELTIEKDIPIPAKISHGANSWSILSEMKVGDSVAVSQTNNPNSRRATIASSARHYGVKVTIRSEGDNFRVWRIKDTTPQSTG